MPPIATTRDTATIRALFEEVADVDWRRPDWLGALMALSASEALAARRFTAEAAAEAFVRALAANGSLAADTFMATAAPPSPSSIAGRVELAVRRARAACEVFAALDRITPDQPLVAALSREDGWLRARPLAGPGLAVAFLVGDHARLARIGPHTSDADLALALTAALEGRSGGLPVVDVNAAAPTPAAVAIALEPVPSTWARSFHRLAWSRGGGPWMGIGDTDGYAIASTCHAAVDGYVHARVADAVLRPRVEGAARSAPASEGPSAARARVIREHGAPPRVGFASCRIEGEPRFARAVHAFATVLDRALGEEWPARRVSVPFHVPIAPGGAGDDTRWRRRPLYGLLALRRTAGALESREALAARLPAWIAREASGAGLLARVLRATLEVPGPLQRRLVTRRPWTDRFLAPARVLTGGGYLSWMRFSPEEAPTLSLHPSAVPSFTEARGGAGLSITRSAGGLSVGLTTSGPIGTTAAAEAFLAAWRDELAR